ncbi:hypothetical protein Srubr_80330 [Streptomyces rubradiris]|uniref:AAA+ ATPase domain-containing protein n=2 Tax=Streptomyces rubradiris TaxID=285531 RepID=A0ABQ3RAP6_STRRR|nr:hypothetical protein GCM10018792_76980 [Streptomyces rubradiris]GHI52908.1 hypothetical protein Srubr_27540 [Streptomyces rubradiris]GHI58187.1 hypothetical protein Srubr_80330 [Streptomyces rubradiris]
MTTRSGGSTPFSRELEALLAERQLSWRKLAQRVGYTAGWLSKVKNGRPPSEDLARLCDEALDAGGRLIALAGGQSVRPQAARTGKAPLAQLPVVTAGFVGRESELAQLDAVLNGPLQPGTPRTVAIDGPPGVGKTALALRWAHNVAPFFPDGQLYVDLQGYSGNGPDVYPEVVLEKFLFALGVPASDIPEGSDERAALYRSLLVGRRVLLILDNAADSGQVEPLLPAASDCAVVITSRSRLFAMAVRTHATRVTLRPLSRAESHLLLRTVLGPERVAGQMHALDELARLCGRLPLALRIVAEHAVVDPHLSPEQMLSGLVVEERLLELLSPDDSIAVRAVFSWSYRKLDDDCRRMFRLLSLHPGTAVSAQAAAALAGWDRAHVVSVLERLHSTHLLERLDGGAYRLHGLLRLYAAERARVDENEDERRRAVERLVLWYLRAVTAARGQLAPFRSRLDWLHHESDDDGPGPFCDAEAALRWCDVELPNFVPVCRLAAEWGCHDVLAAFVLRLFDYLMLRKPWTVWVTSHQLGLEAAEKTGDQRALAWLKTHLAHARWWLRDRAESGRLYEEAMALHRACGDRCGEAWSLAGMATAARDRGDPGQAYGLSMRAVRIFEEVGDEEGHAAALAILCDIETQAGKSDAALEAVRHSLRLCEEIRDHQRLGRGLIKMSGICEFRGDVEQALRYARLAIDLHRSDNDRWSEAGGLVWLGDLLARFGEKDRATEAWNAALRLYDELGDPRAESLSQELQRTS